MVADWSPDYDWRRPLLFVVATLVVASTAIGAAASPQIFIINSKVQKNTALVDRSVNVTVRLKNTGSSGGALEVNLRSNGSASKQEYIQVEPGEERRVVLNLTFEQPGKYRVTVNQNKAGVVHVRRVRAIETASWSEGRTIRIRGQSVPAGTVQTVAFPESSQPFDVTGVDIVASDSEFAQDVTVYGNVSNASVPVPSGDTATVVGVMVISDTPAVERATVRFTLNRSRLTESGLDADAVTVYHRSGDRWKPLATEQVESGPNSVTYEATVTNFSTFVVGSFEPSFTLGERTLKTADTPGGQRVILTGTVSNTGTVAGEYTARMIVNGQQVSEQTVVIPADESRTIRLNHTVTEAGTYDVTFNNQTVGTVQIVASDVSSGGDGADDASTDTPMSSNPGADGNADGNGNDGGPALPSSVAGLGLPYLLGGGIVVLVLVLAILLVAERR